MIPQQKPTARKRRKKLGVAPERVFKTLVVAKDKDLVVAVVPVLLHLDLKLMAKAVGAKKVAMADVRQVERTTGYVCRRRQSLGAKKAAAHHHRRFCRRA